MFHFKQGFFILFKKNLQKIILQIKSQVGQLLSSHGLVSFNPSFVLSQLETFGKHKFHKLH